MTLSSLIKEHKIYWLKGHVLHKGTYSKDWSLLIFYYMVMAGTVDFYKEKAIISHSWGFLLDKNSYFIGLEILENFLKAAKIAEKDITNIITNMKTVDSDKIMFIHYGFVVDYDKKTAERILCKCSYCLKPLVENNDNGESEIEIAAQLMCV